MIRIPCFEKSPTTTLPVQYPGKMKVNLLDFHRHYSNIVTPKKNLKVTYWTTKQLRGTADKVNRSSGLFGSSANPLYATHTCQGDSSIVRANGSFRDPAIYGDRTNMSGAPASRESKAESKGELGESPPSLS